MGDTAHLPALSGLRARLLRQPLREQIADGLASQIESGLLGPGDELPGERELAAILEVGRESVRSALQVLAARGMVEISHGARCRVRGPGGAGVALPPPDRCGVDAMAVLEARLALEPALAGRAAANLTDGDLARLRRLVAAQREMTRDPVRFQISDREFHTLLYREAGNAILAGFAEGVYASAYPMRWEVMRFADGVARALEDHTAILAALESRDEAATAAAMAAHIRHIHEIAAAYRGAA